MVERRDGFALRGGGSLGLDFDFARAEDVSVFGLALDLEDLDAAAFFSAWSAANLFLA